MNDIVALSKAECPVCAKLHTRNCKILLDKTLGRSNTFKKCADLPIELMLCEEHYDSERMVCIGTDDALSTPKSPYKNGVVISIRHELAKEIFSDLKSDIEFCFITEDVQKLLMDMYKNVSQED